MGNEHDLLLHWTCSGADPEEAARLQVTGELSERVFDYADADNIVEVAIDHHPEPERVRRLMGMVNIYATELGDGDVQAWIEPLMDVALVERHGITGLPSKVRRRPQG
jgi:hypothetical protein